MSTPTSSSELDVGYEVSRKPLKEEKRKNSVGGNSNLNDETEVEVIGERPEEVKVNSTEQTMLNTGDETSRKSLKEKLLKIIEKESSKQNGGTKTKVIDDTRDHVNIIIIIICVKCWGRGQQNTPKRGNKKISLEENSIQNDETEPEWLRIKLIVAKTEYAESVDLCGKEIKAKQEAIRNSREEPPPKKKPEEKNGKSK
ncbi:hypothetical protein MKW98_011843 [Papaver atlanticum]|uniref:Uncharacterized protein n=1 Tax=Papaver atlanticum TaxID=357466 RepID=A0AAD4SPL4_9MAGN|nr:hypothetical protein MKW98_011843 [Papaver atlanticum]